MNLFALCPKCSKSLLTAILIIISRFLFGQTFQTAIGYPLPTNERGVSGLIANNGDYLMLGSNVSHPSGFFNPAGDMQLVRLDNLGNIIQPCKIIGQDVGETAAWMEKATDCANNAGYIIAGNEFNGPGHNMLLTLTNSAGTPVWVKRIGTLNDDEQSVCVKQDGARNFILVGTKTDAITGLSSIHAVKTDCMGNLLWERVYSLNVSISAASVTAFATFPNACPNLPNAYFITGKKAASAIGNEEVLILSVNAANGAAGWMKTYDIAPGAADAGTCIQGSCSGTAAAVGNLWVSGYSLQTSGTNPKKVMMLQTDLSGNLLWANNYDVQNSTLELATHFQFAANGKLVLTGKAEDPGVSDPPENGQCMLMRIDDNGSSVDWTRVYTMGFASQGNRVEPTAADEYFITGHTCEIIAIQQFDYNILAIKTDTLGHTTASCFHSPETVIVPRQPVTTSVQPTPTIPQDFFGSSLLTVLYDEKQTFCPQKPPVDPEWCEDNIVMNGNFSAGLAPGNLGFGGTISNWATWTASPQVLVGDTCQDAGAVQMWGNQVVGESIQQPVTFVMGGIYEISFCGKWLNTVQDSVRFRFRASTGLPGSYLNCTGTCDEMYLSPVQTTSWATYTSAPWTAPQNFNTLTISIWNNFAINDGAFVSWGRIDDVCIRRIGTSATHEATGAEDATLFPNPTNGNVTIQFKEALNAETMISVLDLTGRTVLQTIAAQGQTSQNLSLDHCPAGIYLVRAIRGGRAVWSEKVVKE